MTDRSIIDEIKDLLNERTDMVLAAIEKRHAVIDAKLSSGREDAEFRRSVDNLTSTMINGIHQDMSYMHTRMDQMRKELMALREKVRKLSGEP